jgi:hypothetical protein
LCGQVSRGLRLSEQPRPFVDTPVQFSGERAGHLSQRGGRHEFGFQAGQKMACFSTVRLFNRTGSPRFALRDVVSPGDSQALRLTLRTEPSRLE